MKLKYFVRGYLIHCIGYKISKEINTYDISIRPYEDCCTIFTPKQPKTKPHLDKVIEFESKFNFQTLVDECVEKVETIKIK